MSQYEVDVLPEAAVRLFHIMRVLDDAGLDGIVAEPVSDTGLGKERFLGSFEVRWFNPRSGGPLQTGSVANIDNTNNASHTAAGDNDASKHLLGQPPSDPDQDWVVLVRRSK